MMTSWTMKTFNVCNEVKVLTYDDLLIVADNEGIIVKEKPLRGNKGRIKGNRIAIKKDIPLIEKKCILAEELGYYYTTTGNILNQKETQNRKQENIARLWSYNHMRWLVLVTITSTSIIQ